MRDGGRRARIMAAVTEHDTAAGVGDMVQRLCRLAMKMALPGCALVLMPRAESASVLAGAGRHARTGTRPQTERGEGICLHAHASEIPAPLPHLSAQNATGMIAAQLDDTAANALARCAPRHSRAGAGCTTLPRT